MTLKITKPTGQKLVIQKPTGQKLKFRPAWQPMDPDAATYITAVETADGQALEEKVKIAIDNFVLGCKADGIWNAIKASCILAGARTKEGAIIPLAKTSAVTPTLNGTAGGWNYNRKTGLQGNGTDNYINSGRNNNADPQNNFHLATRVTSFGTTASVSAVTAGAGGSNPGRSVIAQTVATSRSTAASPTFTANTPTLIGTSRSAADAFTLRVNGANSIVSVASQSPGANAFYVFARENGSGAAQLFTDCRLAFYSIGESLDLALLDARVTALINAFGTAIA